MFVLREEISFGRVQKHVLRENFRGRRRRESVSALDFQRDVAVLQSDEWERSSEIFEKERDGVVISLARGFPGRVGGDALRGERGGRLPLRGVIQKIVHALNVQTVQSDDRLSPDDELKLGRFGRVRGKEPGRVVFAAPMLSASIQIFVSKSPLFGMVTVTSLSEPNVPM